MFSGLQYFNMLEFIIEHFFTDRNLYNVRKKNLSIILKFDEARMTTSQPLSYKTITSMFKLDSIKYLPLG